MPIEKAGMAEDLAAAPATIAIIPARGGSKGIPRKSIRPLAGKPMIFYAIDACLNCRQIGRVVVSTDDDEIALLSERFGANVIMRPPALADDVTPLDPVIAHAVTVAEQRFGETYGAVLTVQPTSPLVTAADLVRAVSLLESQPPVDTVISVVDDRHLSWTLADGKPVPAYAARVNRQKLEPRFRETGAIIACQRAQLRTGTRIGERIHLLEMPATRSVDIDTYSDLFLCESILSRRRVVFAVTGYPAIGLGHAYRALMLAHELVQCDVRFVCERRSALSAGAIAQQNYEVETCPDGQLLNAVLALKPDLVINDLLDTDAAYVRALKDHGCRVVNFEDLGPGSALADLVVNALYDGYPSPGTHLVGPQYFCLRDEFLYLPRREPRDDVRKILVTFGGVDENNLTARVVDALVPECGPRGIAIDVVVGPGYRHQDELRRVVERHAYPALQVAASTSRISDFMVAADIAVTSGGRTVLELASLAIPTLVICQNEREATHSFATWENGVLNLGLHSGVTGERIAEQVSRLVDGAALRQEMRGKLANWDLTKGKRRVANAIVSLLG